MRSFFLLVLVLCLSSVTELSGQSLGERIDAFLASTQDAKQVEKLSYLLLEAIDNGDIVSDTIFERVIALAKNDSDTLELAIIYLNQSVYYLNIGEVKKGLISIEQAIGRANELNDDFFLAESFSTKMQLLMASRETKQAAELASLLIKKYHDAGDLYYEAETYQMLSRLSSSLGNHSLTLRYDSTAVALARESEYIDVLITSLYSASDNLSSLGYFEKALELAEEALALAKEYEIEGELGNIISAIAEANTQLGNYTEAYRDYETLEDLEGEQQFTWWMTSRSILLQRIGRHDEARKILLEVVKKVKETSNDPLELKRSYAALQTVDLNQNQYDTVAYYGKLMAAQQDSLQASENIRSILELEEKYEAKEKAEKIEQQERELSLRNTQLFILVMVLLFVLLASLGYFALNRRLKKRNVENERLVSEKETLIGEIHHRVKNNLQVVSSLLQIQRRGLESDDEKGREALLESQNRVSAMGLIHNKLYQGRDVTSVDMPEYLEDLGETLLDAYRLEEQVEIFYDVEDINLDVDNAIPLGLIINELVTNSLKYAFPKGREGTIEISFHREEQGLKLRVSDDGVGALVAEKRADSTFFGRNLIGLLTKKLKGDLSILEGDSYGIEILFGRKI